MVLVRSWVWFKLYLSGSPVRLCILLVCPPVAYKMASRIWSVV
uniref:Uncharacterized protein n=1 Tax=Aegilops tauschii subsp. strangulata TaxID=200361 RepID=A0A453IY81_AEGTS